MFRAIVRPPGDSYPEALTRQQPPPPIDLALAREQHRAFVSALRASGADVVELPAPAAPDGVFVQDPILVAGGRAIVARAAAASRAGEADELLAALSPEVPVARLEAPATLDGGDVLVTPERLIIGLSERTNRAACEQLAALTGLHVDTVPVPGDLLHLLTGCSWLGGGRALVAPPLSGLLPGVEEVPVPPGETYAANCLAVGRHAIAPAGFPATHALLAERGFEVHPVEMSELAKRDGGVTCLALLLDPPAPRGAR